MAFELEIDSTVSAKLKVIGVGGAGGNAVNRMIGAGLRGVDFIVANTDVQALNQSLAPARIQIGITTTRGLGSGGDPTQGRRSADATGRREGGSGKSLTSRGGQASRGAAESQPRRSGAPKPQSGRNSSGGAPVRRGGAAAFSLGTRGGSRRSR